MSNFWKWNDANLILLALILVLEVCVNYLNSSTKLIGISKWWAEKYNKQFRKVLYIPTFQTNLQCTEKNKNKLKIYAHSQSIIFKIYLKRFQWIEINHEKKLFKLNKLHS